MWTLDLPPWNKSDLVSRFTILLCQLSFTICNVLLSRSVFDYCLWGQIASTSGDGSDESPFSYDFSQTVLAASGEHEAYDDSQTITSDPELLCVDAEAEAVTCRMEHIAADGSGGGWIWDNLPCEPGIDMENRAWDPTPEGTERCVCTSSTASYEGNNGIYSYDGPVSAAQCAHLICHSSGHDNYIFESCAWDGQVVATAEPDDNQHYTRVTSDPAALCSGVDPDPLGKCKGTWDRPDREGCIGIIQRGRTSCGSFPCDGLTHEGGSWTEGHDENGRYITGRGTGSESTRYPRDLIHSLTHPLTPLSYCITMRHIERCPPLVASCNEFDNDVDTTECAAARFRLPDLHPRLRPGRLHHDCTDEAL